MLVIRAGPQRNDKNELLFPGVHYNSLPGMGSATEFKLIARERAGM